MGYQYEMTAIPLTHPGQEALLFRGAMPWGLKESANQSAYESLLATHKIQRAFVLTTSEEIEFARDEKGPNALEFYASRNIEVIHFPMQDGGVPNDTERFKTLIQTIVTDIMEQKRVLIHCMGGKGRTGVVIASALKYLIPLQDTIKYLRNFVPGAIETRAQEAYVNNFRL